MTVALAYKNFAASRNISHIGLGVAALNTAKVLRGAGIRAEVWPILSAGDLRSRLESRSADHVMISAPWIPAHELQALASAFPETQFAVNCHSNVGFLQADRNGTRLLRESIEIELGTFNVHVAGNSRRFCEWVRAAWGAPCAYLPNLYYLHEHRLRRHHSFSGGTLRIGVFGATRPLKNLMSAAGAALQIARELHAPLELWISAGRAEGGGETVLASIKELLQGLPHASLVLNGWQSWPKFRQTIAHMHLLLQPSYTESFNMVTADGVAEGVPSVVSPAIDWAPTDWKADPDNVFEIARTGRRLLLDPHAAEDGVRALERYVADGVRAYEEYLETEFRA
ncbi:MAG TPA: hypothetical protein VF283_11270 [Bryobacteraceae bacterium]